MKDSKSIQHFNTSKIPRNHECKLSEITTET